MDSEYSPPWMSVGTEMGCEWDVGKRASIVTADGVLGTGEEARGLTVAASAIWDTRGSGGRAIDKAVAHGVSPVTESSMIWVGGPVLIRKSCLATQ